MSLDTSKCLCIQLSLHRHMSQCLLSCESQHVHVRMYIWLPSVCNIFNLWRNCVQIKTFSFTIRSWSNSKTCPTGYKMKKKKKIGVIWRCWFDWLAERERGKTALIGLFTAMTGTVARQSVKFPNYNVCWHHPHAWWWKRANYPSPPITAVFGGADMISGVIFVRTTEAGRWFERQAGVCVCGVKRRLYMFVEAYVWPPCSGVDLGKSNLVESHNSTSLNISRWFLWKPHALQKD